MLVVCLEVIKMLSIDELFSKVNSTNSVDKLLDLRNSISDSIEAFEDDTDMVKDFNSVINLIDKRLKSLS